MTEQFWWYVARASGMVAAVLLVLTLIWGLLITTKLIDRRGLPAWLTDLHRYLGGLSVVFIAVHMVSLVFDNYLVFSWSDLFVPFASSWRPVAVAGGVIAAWLLVAVETTSLAKRWLPRRLDQPANLFRNSIGSGGVLNLLPDNSRLTPRPPLKSPTATGLVAGPAARNPQSPSLPWTFFLETRLTGL